MVNLKGHIQADGSVLFKKTFYKNRGKGCAVKFLRIDTRTLKQAQIAPGDSCTVTVRRLVNE